MCNSQGHLFSWPPRSLVCTLLSWPQGSLISSRASLCFWWHFMPLQVPTTLSLPFGPYAYLRWLYFCTDKFCLSRFCCRLVPLQRFPQVSKNKDLFSFSRTWLYLFSMPSSSSCPHFLLWVSLMSHSQGHSWFLFPSTLSSRPLENLNPRGIQALILFCFFPDWQNLEEIMWLSSFGHCE